MKLLLMILLASGTSDAARQCFKGFKRIAGGIPGKAQIQGDIDTDEIGCVYLCNDHQDCCSYEHSPTKNLCNLHKDCKSKGKNKEDFKLCVKETLAGGTCNPGASTCANGLPCVNYVCTKRIPAGQHCTPGVERC